MSGYPFPGPIAPYNNVDIEAQWFEPSAFPLTAISTGTSTTITTGSAFGITNNYVVGQLVRFDIPSFYGIRQLDGQIAYVTQILGTNQVIVNINSSVGYDPFIPSPTYGPTPPQVVAIGDVNSGPINSQGRTNNGTTIPGTFINISPAAGG